MLRSLRSKLIPGVAVMVTLGACAHEERRLHIPAPPQEGSPVASWSGPPQYLVAEPSGGRWSGLVFPLPGANVQGLVIDKRRVVVGQGEPRMANDAAPDSIAGAAKIPARLGGGFVFWTDSSLYRADAFDAKLVPLARLGAIEGVSFGPKFLLVRGRNGERWALGPKGDRVAIQPVGLAQIEALDDGRAIAFDTQNAVFTSVDGGAKWVDVTVQVKSVPSKVVRIDADLWLVETSGGAARVEADGRLTTFDKAPDESPLELRPRDPRWHGALSPLRTAFQSGALIDESTAVVVDAGNLVRVDVRSGSLRSVTPASLPSDSTCEAVPVQGDVLFACVAKSGAGFVVGHTLHGELPVIEQTFSAPAGFYGSDDGGLAYGASCQGVPPRPNVSVVCVRQPGGHWEERDLGGLVFDGGLPNADQVVSRWVPRGDGGVLALVHEPTAGIYNPGDGSFVSVGDEARDAFGGPLPKNFSVARFRGKPAKRFSGVVDTSWTTVGGRLRGWFKRGENIEILEDGRHTLSPYAFEVVHAGPNAIGRSRDGRLYQSEDHGATWYEVAPPPSGVEALDFLGCSTAGCDLGAFYRVGWLARPPAAAPKTETAPAAPEVRRTRGLELSCRPAGAAVTKLSPRTHESPEDLGFGAVKVPVAGEKNDWAFVRAPLTRQIPMPAIHDAPESMGEEGPPMRGLLHGFATSREQEGLVVQGPNRSAMALRRTISWLAPFDPQAKLVRTSIGLADVVVAGRRIGMTSDEVLNEDPIESGMVVPLLSIDPNAASDLAFWVQDHGVVAVLRGERARVAMRPSASSPILVSGVLLPNDEQAFLEVEPNGAGRVFKLGASGTSDLFAVNEAPSDGFYPANPDALAVGPKSELAILRTPSGSDPASALDPALLVVPGQPATALPPWSEVRLADDPACKAEVGGYRAVLQTIGPWIRVTTPDLKVADEPMTARVRWTAKRPCLEGFEVKLPALTLRTPGLSNEAVSFASWLVARGGSYTRVVVGDGAEWRQPLECSVVSTGP